MSNFELEALTAVTRKVLEKDWKIVPSRTYVQCFETSLNAPGWSISLLNASGIERETQVPLKELLDLLDSDTAAPAWPKNGYREIKEVNKADLETSSKAETLGGKGPKVDASNP